jgi:hypothetical protein
VKRVIAIAACAALAVACTPKAKAPAGAAPKLDADLPMTELMAHVIDPGAFMYWRGSGTRIDETGEHDLSPTTEEGWETVISGATIVAEAGNLLQMEGRRRAPEADWNKYAQQLTAQAKIARAAAEKRDKKAVFDEGGRLYEVCVACHEQFVIQPDIKANGPAKGDPLPTLPRARSRNRRRQTARGEHP